MDRPVRIGNDNPLHTAIAPDGANIGEPLVHTPSAPHLESDLLPRSMR